MPAKMRLAVVALLATLLTGCAATPPPAPRLAVFDPAEYAWFVDTVGTGVVEGQAFLVCTNGDTIKAAGREVTIVPVTSATTESYERAVLRYESLEPIPEDQRIGRKVIADADGRFRFENLPAGEYYIACWIDWLEAVPERHSRALYGGGWATYYGTEHRKHIHIAHAKVTVRDGEVTRAVVTR